MQHNNLIKFTLQKDHSRGGVENDWIGGRERED